jgi:hypothetical protein
MAGGRLRVQILAVEKFSNPNGKNDENETKITQTPLKSIIPSDLLSSFTTGRV